MKKIILAALAILVSASFNTAVAADKKKKDNKEKKEPATISLVAKSDSVSYSAGMVRTEGLVPYLKQGFGVDTAYMADFIKGYEDAVAKGINEKTKAYFAGEQIALMVSQRMLPFLKDEFKGQNDSINEALFNKGFVSALKKDYTVMADSVAKKYFDKVFKEAVNARNEATRKAGEDFLAANKTKAGVVTLPSGLQYKVLVKGNGEIPAKDDEVTVKYEGRLIDGTVFDSSYKRPGETSKFRPDQVIKGWTEALTMMPVGSKWELYIPQELAYGERQAGAIKPYSALIFTVEMVSVDKAKKPETEAAAKGTKADKTAKKAVVKKSAKAKK